MNFGEQIFAPAFDPRGLHLVEAGAGTGKTYSLQTLYLRLVLLEGLDVREILVVTFTKSATAELRERLQKVLRETLEGLRGDALSPEERVQRMLDLARAARIPPDEQSRRLRQALLDFDLAAIFTIHGFCGRMLERFAFETGQPFDLEPQESGATELRRLCRDWWRRNIFFADPGLLKLIEQARIDLALLEQVTQKRISKPDAVFKHSGATPEETVPRVQQALNRAYAQTPDPLPPALDAGRTPRALKDLNAAREALRPCIEALSAGDWGRALASLETVAQMKYQEGRRRPPVATLLSTPWRQVLEDIRRSGVAILFGAAESIAANYRREQSERRSVTFDEYLTNLRAALRSDGPDGPLHQALRTSFKAALVDEFQDTDPIQWGIFNELFGGADDHICFLVGDPKQSIYRFRNGDMETYVQATAVIEAHRRHVLDTNYRSEAALIAAVNQLFRDRTRDGSDHTFRHPGIPYRDLRAQGKPPGESLTIGGRIDPRPLKILLLHNDKPGKLPSGASGVARQALALSAAHIAAMLDDDSLRIGEQRLRPGCIAVLVHTHDQAARMERELKQRSIPCVRQGTGNVWQTPEAEMLWTLLQGVAFPRDTGLLRSLLLTPWIGLTHDEVARLNRGEALPGVMGGRERTLALEDWVTFFEERRQDWLTHGFAAMFNKMARDLDLRARLVGASNGLRRLTNLFHLVELVQRETVARRPSPEGVLAWIRQRRDEPEESADDLRLRMESDRDAVRVMTVFNSKGLQFPIVVTPTLFLLKPYMRGRVFEFHRPDDAALAISTDDEDKQQEQREIEIESLRHIYVALTRAVHRTVVLAVHPDEADGNQTLQWLLGDACTPENAPGYFSPDQPEACAIEVMPGDMPPARPWRREACEDLAPPRPLPPVDTSRGHGSFTSLTPHGAPGTPAAPGEDDGRNRDGETVRFESLAGQEADEEVPAGIFAFPAGAKTGTCWHEIFEELDFLADDRTLSARVEEKLQAYGFLAPEALREERLHHTREMVRRTLAQTLPSERDARGGFSLNAVTNANRRTEWAFNFSTRVGGSTASLRRIIARDARYAAFLPEPGHWELPVPGGYLTGFVDLLFRHDGRYYVVDWKSNRRGGRPEDFTPDGLREEMTLHGYWLQLLIYCVAVHRFLADRLEDYDYDRHFGGAYYVFLRGIDGRERGIWADRPSRALIEDLANQLGNFA